MDENTVEVSAQSDAPKRRGALLTWLRRPQWQLRTLFLLFLAVALVLGLWRTFREPTVEWIPYSSATLTRCRDSGRPVLVLYQSSHSPLHAIYASCPFDRRDVAELVERMRMVAMNGDMMTRENCGSEHSALYRELASLPHDPSMRCPKLPLIVIYDSRYGKILIPPHDESYDDREARIARLLHLYANGDPALFDETTLIPEK